MLHLSHNPETDMKRLNGFYRLKEGVSNPDRYLGANVEKYNFLTAESDGQ